ncbi:methanobactin export MATE transporter MbnM [Methylocystis sp. JAN1]|uniref:methanobactin export MATE transporter MbnM n=1 Tax=Methylocystis sp. JAN1 TaxID=3397211 RepID=UPI003FA30113
MKEASLWRGFFPLLASLSIAPISFQVDLAMVAKLGVGAPAAYALLARIALLDSTLVAAVGVVASVMVAKARDRRDKLAIIGQLWAAAFAVGLCACAVGCAVYPTALRLIGGTREVVALASAALGWHLAAIPFRILSGVGLFILFAMERGRLALSWKLFEVALKAIGAYALIYPFGFGFAGCFVAGFATSVAGAATTFGMVCAEGAAAPRLPPWSFARAFLADAMWEASRILSPQLLVLASLALFAAPWLGRFEPERVDSYAAGQILVLFLFTPFTALTRFLAMRLTGSTREAIAPLLRQGLPIALVAAALLLIGGDWLGAAIYQREGRWWSAFVEALALSLPIRYAANVMRGALQSGGRFADAAATDGFAAAFVALPLTAIGLHLDTPAIAYLALVAPETLCAAILWNRVADARAARAQTVLQL